MATIHFQEIIRIIKILRKKGHNYPITNINISDDDDHDDFFEVRFDNPNDALIQSVVDEEFKNKVMTVDCSYGIITIIFNEYGELRSIDLS